MDIVVSSGKGSTKTISKDISLPSVDMDINLKVYRNGTLVEEKTINPAYIGSSYNLTYTGTSGQETVVVQLNGNDYMYLSFNYDTKEATITQTIDFVPPSDNSGGDNPDSSGSSGGDDDGRGSGGGAISNN